MARKKSYDTQQQEVKIVEQQVNVSLDNQYHINVLTEESTINIKAGEVDNVNVKIDGVKGDKGDKGSDGAGIGTRLDEVILLPSETKVVDSFLLSSFRSIEYIITLYDDLSLLYKKYNLSLIHNNTDVRFSIYAIIGDDIEVVTDINMNSTNAFLSLTNNHNNTIKFKALRFENSI